MTNVYARADKIIYNTLREASKKFKRAARKLSTTNSALAAFDEINLLFTEVDELATDAYLLIAEEGYSQIGGVQRPRKIDLDFVFYIEGLYDPITGYIYYNEYRRKQERLKEAVVAAMEANKPSGDTEVTQPFIRKLDELFTKFFAEVTVMFQQFAIIFTDDSRIAAMEDANIKKVRWEAVGDERTCATCMALDGHIFPVTAVPAKHYRCRCVMVPVT